MLSLTDFITLTTDLSDCSRVVHKCMHKNLLDKEEQDRLRPIEEDHVVGEVPGVAKAAERVHRNARVERVHVQQVDPPARQTIRAAANNESIARGILQYRWSLQVFTTYVFKVKPTWFQNGPMPTYRERLTNVSNMNVYRGVSRR